MIGGMRYLALVVCVAACGSDDADVAGNYTTMVTNRDNGCNFANWTVGDNNDASVTLTQSGNDVTMTVTGLGALVLEASLGGHVYAGKVNGTTLAATLFGTRSNTTGTCTYTFNSEIHAEVHGDILTGQIDYSAATDGSPDCATITNCRSFQDFNGIRPPP
jgi:hypothetical protein